MSADEPARTIAVRHLSADIAQAHAEGDSMTAKTLARALSSLIGAGEGGAGDVIEIDRARKKRS